MQIFFGAMMYLFVCQSLALHDNGTDFRIYKGTAPLDGQFPFMVFILVGLFQGNDYEPSRCTGSLIKLDTVLTAAHCLHNDVPFDEYGPGNVVVMVGKADALEYSKFRMKHPINVKYTTTPPETHQESIALRLFMHPKYSNSYVYDIGIIKIAKPFEKAKYVNTIPISTDEYPGKLTCYLIGFGESHLKSFGKLNYFTTQKIQNDLKDCGYLVSIPSLYCLRKKRQSDPAGCVGDSGSPLVCQNKVYGIYKGIIFYPEEPDEENCGDSIISTFVKLSISEKGQVFLKKYAKEIESESSKAVPQFYCSLYYFLFILILQFFLLN